MARGWPWNVNLGGGFEYFFMFIPIWEDEPILTFFFFQMGWFNHHKRFAGLGRVYEVSEVKSRTKRPAK